MAYRVVNNRLIISAKGREFADACKEIFKSECLPDGEINFNGVGGASLHLEESILLSIGVPGWNGVEIAKLAQNPKSFFGKIIQINKKNYKSAE